jgi:hypothetical protein
VSKDVCKSTKKATRHDHPNMGMIYDDDETNKMGIDIDMSRITK